MAEQCGAADFQYGPMFKQVRLPFSHLETVQKSIISTAAVDDLINVDAFPVSVVESQMLLADAVVRHDNVVVAFSAQRAAGARYDEQLADLEARAAAFAHGYAYAGSAVAVRLDVQVVARRAGADDLRRKYNCTVMTIFKAKYLSFLSY